MKKLKKWVLAFLTVGMALAFSVACGENKDDGDSSNAPSSSVSSSSSSVSSEEVSSETSSEVSSESSSESSSDVSSSSSSVSSEESSSESSSETSSGEDGGEGEHVCITDGEWVSNSSGHWLVCTCGEFVQVGVHSGGTPKCGEKPVCGTCGATYGKEKEHEYGELSDGEFGKAYYCACGDYLTNEDLVDFIVEVESGKDPVVLQLSDTQICNWGDLNEWCYKYVKETVEATKPDLIILTGDVVYGKFDPSGALLTSLIKFMETLNTPWAPVFGNHDNESLKGVDWQCAQFEAAENCLFKQGDLTGNGNYSVGIEQDGELLRVFYMMDSNGCGVPMIDQNGNAVTPEPGTNEVRMSAGFSSDQVMWFTNEIETLHALDADVKISFAFHIQQIIFHTVFEKYDEYDGILVDGSNSELKNPLNLDTLETADETDFGYIGRTTKVPWDVGNAVFKKMKELGTDSIFVGHEHCNSASIVYEGVRFQYGQKSSLYDRYNSLMPDGTFVGNNETPAGGKPLIGGTVIPISSEDGSILTGYIYYCGDPFGTNPELPDEPNDPENSDGGDVGGEETEKPEEIVVDGLAFSEIASNLTVTTETVAGENAYKVTASTQGKVYMDTALVANKQTLTFTTYVAEDAGNTCAFMIRLKPNENFSDVVDAPGYIYYQVSNRVTLGEWQTFTVDLSSFKDTCTEFSFVITAGQTVYFRDITII